ncbi:MAG: translocation/assembly module TamB domain-containing protein [Myxococcota bacterium]
MKTRWLKTTGKIIGGLVLGVIVLLLLVVLFLQTSAGQGIALDQGLARANAALAGEVEAENLEGGLLDGLSVENVRLRDARGNTVAYIERVSVDYSLLGLPAASLSISDLQVDAPVVVSRTYPDGASNFSLITEPTPQEPSGPGTFELFLERAAIDSGTVLVIDETLEGVDASDEPLADWLATLEEDRVDVDTLSETLPAAIPTGDKPAPETFGLVDLSADATFTMRGSMDYAATLTSLKAHAVTDSVLGRRGLSVGVLDARYRPDRAEVTLDRLGIDGLAELLDLRVAADLTVEEDSLGNRTPTGLERYFADIGELTAQPRVAEIYDAGLGLAEPVSAEARAAGDLDAHTFDLSVACPEPNSLRAAGRVRAPDGNWGELEYDVSLLTDEFSGEACAEATAPIRRLSAAARATGRGTAPESLTSSIDVSIEEAQLLDYEVNSARIDVDARDGRATVDTLEIDTPYAKANGSGSADLDGDFDIELAVEGSDQLGERAGRAAGRQVASERVDLTVGATGKLDLDSEDPAGMVRRLELRSNWNIDRLAMEDSVKIGSSTGDVSLDVETPDGTPNKRRVRFDTEIEARALDSPMVSASYFFLDAEGSGLVQLPLDDPLAALEELSAKWTFRTRNLRAPDTRISAANIRGRVSRTRPGGSLAWVLDGTASGVRAAGQSIGFADVDLRGTAALRSGEAGTSVTNISARGAVSGSNIDAGGVTAEKIDADLDVRGRPPLLDGKVDVRAQNIQAGGEAIDSASATLELSGDRHFDLTAKVKRAGESAPLALDTDGTLDRDLSGVTFDDFEAGSDEMTWSMSPGAGISFSGGKLAVDELELKTGDQRIRVDGAYRDSGTQGLDAEFENISIREIREGLDIPQIPDLRGQVTGSASLRGTSRDPIVTVDILLEEFFYQGYGPFQLVAKADYRDDVLDASKLVFSGYDVDFVRANGRFPIDLDLEGNYEILRDEPMRVDLEIPEIDLPDVYALAPQLEDYRAVGSVEGKLKLDGTLRAPNIKTRVSAQKLGVNGDVGGQRVELQKVDFAASVDYRPPRNDLGGLDLDLQGDWRGERILEANVATPMPLSTWANELVDGPSKDIDWIGRVEALPFDMKVDLKSLNLSKVPIESLAKADAEGEVIFNMEGSGTFASPDITLDAGLHDFGWDRFRDMYIDLNLEQRAGTLYIERVRFEWDADEIFVAEGKFPTPVAQILGREEWRDIPIDFTLQLRELPVKKLSAVDYQFSGIQGSFAGYVQASGSLREPDLQGRLGLFNTELARGRTGTVALEFGANRGSVRARASVCQDTREVLFANARVPVNLDVISLAEGNPFLRDETVRGSIKSESLQLAQVLPTRLFDQYASNIGGEFKVDMSVFGKLDDLRAEGMLQLKNGEVTLPTFGRRFEDIQIGIDVDEERLQVNSLGLEEAGSKAQMTGTVGLDGIQPTTLDMNLETEEFNIGGFGTTFAAFITSNIDITGDLTGAQRDIKVVATELEVGLPESQAGDLHPTELNEDLVVIRRNARQDAMGNLENLTSQDTEAAESKPLELRVVAEPGSWLRHPNGDVEFKTDISIRIADSGIQMGGTVDTIRGSIEFLGKRFDIPEKNGVVRFTGAATPNPVLDAEAIHVLDQRIAEALQEPTSGDARIVVRVRGRADDPNLLLSSDPGMTESDIIQVLVTGRPPSDSGVGQDQGLQGQALSAASGLLSGLVQQKLAGAVPVDVLRLEAGDKGLGSSRISVGKYITERLFVSYSYKFGSEEEDAENVAKIEYRFAPRWKLETEYSDQQTGEFNIFWEPPLRWLND